MREMSQYRTTTGADQCQQHSWTTSFDARPPQQPPQQPPHRTRPLKTELRSPHQECDQWEQPRICEVSTFFHSTTSSHTRSLLSEAAASEAADTEITSFSECSYDTRRHCRPSLSPSDPNEQQQEQQEQRDSATNSPDEDVVYCDDFDNSVTASPGPGTPPITHEYLSKSVEPIDDPDWATDAEEEADTYWEWDQKKEKFRHQDENGEIVYFPDELC